MRNKGQIGLAIIIAITMLMSIVHATVAIYNYTDTTYNKAWESDDQANLPPTTRTPTNLVEALSADYTNIASLNNAWWESVEDGTDYVIQYFNLTINQSVSSITQLNATWIGFKYGGLGNVRIYIWNSTGYEYLGQATGYSNVNISKIATTNIGNYINGTSHTVDLIAEYSVPGKTSSYGIETDFVVVKITYNPNTAPVVTTRGIRPSTAYSNNAMYGNITITDNDAGDTLTGYCQPWINSTSYGAVQSGVVTNNTVTEICNVAAGVTGKNGYIMFEMWGGDGIVNTSKGNTSNISISNTAPTQPTLTAIAPATAYTYSNLSANASESTDIDGDSITYYYQWLDTDNATVLQAWSDNNWFSCTTSGCDKGDNIILRAWAYTTLANSTSEYRNRAITDKPPSKPDLSTNATIKVGQSMVGVCENSTDIDGDSISYYLKFYNENDTTTRQDWSTDTSYTIAVADAHDNITIQCKAYAGGDYSSIEYVSRIVSDSEPTKPPTLTTNSTVTIYQSMVCNCSGSTDADGDSIAYYCRFYNQNHSVAVQNWSTDTSYPVALDDYLDNITIVCRANTTYANSTDEYVSRIIGAGIGCPACPVNPACQVEQSSTNYPDYRVVFGFILVAICLTLLYIYSNSMYGAMYGAVAGILLISFGLIIVIWPLGFTHCEAVITAQNGTDVNISIINDILCESNKLEVPSTYSLFGWIFVFLGIGNIVVLVRNLQKNKGESD